MWHSHLNDTEIPETKSCFIPKGFELGTTLQSQLGRSICYLISDLRVRSLYPKGRGGGGDAQWKFGYKSVAEAFKSRPCLRQKLLVRNYVINMSRAYRRSSSSNARKNLWYPGYHEQGQRKNLNTRQELNLTSFPTPSRMLKPMRYTCTIRRTCRVSWAVTCSFCVRQGALFYDPDPFSFCFQINYYFKLISWIRFCWKKVVCTTNVDSSSTAFTPF